MSAPANIPVCSCSAHQLYQVGCDCGAEDATIDRWNNAVLAALRGQPCPGEDVDSIDGYRHGLEQRKVQPVMPERSEGYYHMAPESDQ